MRATPSARAIAYLRVSTDQQAESGLGLEAQEAAVRSAASRLRLEVVRVFVDGGTSGKLGDRGSARAARSGRCASTW